MPIQSWMKRALWGGSLGFQAAFVGSLILPLVHTMWYRLASGAPPHDLGVAEVILEFGTVAFVVFISAAIPGTLGGVLLGLGLHVAMQWRHPIPPFVGGVLGAALGTSAGMGAYSVVLRLLGVSPPRAFDSLATVVLGLSLLLGGLTGIFLTWAINQEPKTAT